MMSVPRARRLPVSCEPCRIRKIRCPRDIAPCAACRRRGVAGECRYAKKPSIPHPSAHVAPVATISPLSPPASSPAFTTGSSDLVERVNKLERLLQGQTCASNKPAVPLGIFDNLRGSLRTTKSGHLRFVPHNADWVTTLHSAEDGPPLGLVNETNAYGMGSGTVNSTQELLINLPPTDACTALVQIYFSSFASLFHILHDPTFQEQYAAFLQDPGSMPLAWLALLYSLLAVACLALPVESHLLRDLSRQRTPSAKVADLSQRYRNMVMKCLEEDHYLWNHSVTTLQALIILIYGIGHSHGQTFTLVGLTHHLALSIGCHVDPEHLNLGAIESEERRRSWAGLMMLYTTQDITLGHLGQPHTALRCNSRPPADVDDENIGISPSGASGKATQMTYLLLKFRLYDICAEICNRVLGIASPQLDTIWRIDAAIQEEQRSLDLRYSHDTRSAPLPVHHQAHLHILDSYGNHLTLLLHHQHATGARSNGTCAEWSRQRCIESARKIIKAHETLNMSTELAPFRWYGRGLSSFYAFHAAVVIVSLLPGATDQQEQELNIEMLQDTLHRFEDIAELSIMCAKAAPILRSLLSKLSASSMSREHHTPQVETPTAASHDVRTPNSLAAVQSQQQVDPLADDMDWDAFLGQLQPQQWLAPASLPWDQWHTAWVATESTASVAV